MMGVGQLRGAQMGIVHLGGSPLVGVRLGGVQLSSGQLRDVHLVPTVEQPGGAELSGVPTRADGSLPLRLTAEGLTPADAAVTGGMLNRSTQIGVVPGGWTPSGLVVSEGAPSGTMATKAAQSRLTPTGSTVVRYKPTTGSTLFGATP